MISKTTATHAACPTVYFLQCPVTVPPRFGGKRRLPRPHSCAPPLLVTIKGGGGLPLDSLALRTSFRMLKTLLDLSYRGHLHSRPSPHSTLLTETWELPSLSRLACTPYYKHSGCKIIQCTRTPPLLDVRPRGRNQDKHVRYCVASCINHLGRGTRSIITSWVRTVRSGHRQPSSYMIRNTRTG